MQLLGIVSLIMRRYLLNSSSNRCGNSLAVWRSGTMSLNPAAVPTEAQPKDTAFVETEVQLGTTCACFEHGVQIQLNAGLCSDASGNFVDDALQCRRRQVCCTLRVCATHAERLMVRRDNGLVYNRILNFEK